MKAKLNLDIDLHLLEAAKETAHIRSKTLSEIVEDYFRTLTQVPHQKNFLELVDSLRKPHIDRAADLKELYFQEQKEKYGFP